MKPPHPLAIPKKPQGQLTRGKTARNRLRQVDNFMLLYDPDLLTRRDGPFDDALFVDLGYGAEPFTAIESAERFRRLNPALKVLGVEIDPERVARAQPCADARTFFRLGGFNLPLEAGETVRAIRAFNVLRQYEEADVPSSWERMARGVLPGGLLVEGTSNPTGGIWAANILRRLDEGQGPAWRQEALVFFTNFSLGFDPVEFQTILPKNYIHRVTPGQPIFDFFAAWKAAAVETIAMQTWGLRQWHIAAAESLAKRGYRINLRRKWLSKGWMIWDGPCA
ncbi:MAG: class I SAM-dependent methyltransferase [Anaerolineales bacterium]